jgi:hypothetical protein
MIIKNKFNTTFSTLLISTCAFSAHAAGLEKAKSVLESLQKELTSIIPIAAAVLLLCLAMGYAGRFVEKDTFVRWAIGIIIGGSATQIVAMFFN